MRNLLLPYNFSSESENALKYACRFAQMNEMAIHLVNIIQEPLVELEVMVPGEYKSVNRKTEQRQEKLQEIADEIMNDYDLLCNVTVLSGAFKEAITHDISIKKFDLIIMGSKGSDSILDDILGTRSYRLAKDAHLPVLIVPEGISYENISKVVYATDYRKEDKQNILHIYDLFKNEKLEVNLVHISKRGNKVTREIFYSFTDEIDDQLGMSSNISYTHFIDQDVEDGLYEHAVFQEADLLTIYMPEKKLTEKIFKSSISKKMASALWLPLLLLPPVNK